MRKLTDIALLHGQIGSGWAGRVFAAELKAAAYGLPAGAAVAIKLYRPDVFVAARGEMERRIERELEFGGQGLSDRVVCALDLVEADEGGLPTLALVMKFLEGRTLDQIVAADFPVCDSDLLTIVADLVTALSDLHGAGLVHRDVKPHNIIISDGRATLMDLGVVKSPADTASGAITPSAELPETIPYADSERMLEGLDDELADAWSLGTTIFYLLYGRPPFQGARRFPEWAAAADPDLIDYPEGKDRFGTPPTAARLYIEAIMRSLLAPRDSRPLPANLDIDFDDRFRQEP